MCDWMFVVFAPGDEEEQEHQIQVHRELSRSRSLQIETHNGKYVNYGYTKIKFYSLKRIKRINRYRVNRYKFLNRYAFW